MKEDLLKIINHYGVMPQLKYFQSEVFELNESIIKEQCGEDDINHIAEEIADCEIFLRQFREYYNISENDIENIIKYKIDRQLERIENEKEIKNEPIDEETKEILEDFNNFIEEFRKD